MRPVTQPRGIERLTAAYPPPAVNGSNDPVVVSLVGLHRWPNAVTLLADPGRPYDWAALRGFTVVLLTRQGIDAGPAVRGLLPVAYWLTLLDADTGWCTDILQITPKPRVIRWRMHQPTEDQAA